MKNERQAHLALNITPEQRNQRNVTEANRRAEINRQLERERRNSEFWHKVMHFISITVVLAFICKLLLMWGV